VKDKMDIINELKKTGFKEHLIVFLAVLLTSAIGIRITNSIFFAVGGMSAYIFVMVIFKCMGLINKEVC